MLPVLNFSGRIKLVDSSADDDESGIRDLLGLTTSSPSVIGFDTESKPSAMYSKDRNPTALIQLASHNACVLYRTTGTRVVPNSLANILADKNITKVGQGVVGDMRGLQSDFENLPQLSGFADLYKVSTRLQCQPRSLQGLVGIFLRKRLLKDMRISNWETPVLRAEQIQYAAIDAWAARAVYLDMKEKGLDMDTWAAVTESDLMIKSFSTVDQHVTPVNVPIVTPPTHVAPDHPSAQVRLVDLCVKNGFLLKLVGFEKASDFSGQFKCLFQVTSGSIGTVKCESATSHTSIRAAQEDAASVMLAMLNTVDYTSQSIVAPIVPS